MNNKHIFAPYLTEETIDQIRISDLLKITHLNLAFGLIKDGEVTVDHLKYLDRIQVYKSINPSLKVSLSVGGWGADGFSQAAATRESRDKFVTSIAHIVTKWDFDGVDIDWEYPCSELAGIAYGPQDKVNYTLLLQDLRNRLKLCEAIYPKKYLLTTAVGGEEFFIQGTQMDKVAEILDYIYLMTYDLRGGFTDVAGHHASLGPQTGSDSGLCAKQTVELYHKAGVPYEKMVLGIATYGRHWCGIKDTTNHGLGAKAETIGTYFSDFNLQDPAAIKGSGFTYHFDEQAQAPYLFNGETFISYEDVKSIQAKCNYVRTQGLAGIMYWHYGDTVLFDEMAKFFKA